MKIGFGVTNLLKGISGSGVDGIGTYTLELYRELLDKPDINLQAFAMGHNEQAFVLGSVVYTNTLPAEFMLASINPRYSYERRVARVGIKPDLIHATDHFIPVVRNVPLVSTIMDVIPIANPEWSNNSASSKIRLAVWEKLARRSDRVITISEYSKNAIVAALRIKPEKISVVPLGVNQAFFERIDRETVDNILSRYGLFNKRFFLNIGTLQPRKNVARLIEAVRSLAKEDRARYPLVIVGKDGWGNDNLLPEIEAAVQQGWCKWLKRVPDIELKALLQSATAMVFPSLCEGFGLPVLEAFASKTPVIASNSSSLEDVAAGYSKMVDPMSVDSIHHVLQKFVDKRGNENEVDINLAYLYAQDMSWAACARKTHEIYCSVIG